MDNMMSLLLCCWFQFFVACFMKHWFAVSTAASTTASTAASNTASTAASTTASTAASTAASATASAADADIMRTLHQEIITSPTYEHDHLYWMYTTEMKNRNWLFQTRFHLAGLLVSWNETKWAPKLQQKTTGKWATCGGWLDNNNAIWQINTPYILASVQQGETESTAEYPKSTISTGENDQKSQNGCFSVGVLNAWLQ